MTRREKIEELKTDLLMNLAERVSALEMDAMGFSLNQEAQVIIEQLAALESEERDE